MVSLVKNTKGFSLLEMIVVMVLVGLLTALSAPTVGNSLSNLRLKTTARKLSAVLRGVRSKAISDKKKYSVALDPDNSSYSYPDNGTNKTISLPENIVFDKIDLKDEMMERQSNVYFYPKGNCTGGSIILSNERKQVVQIKIETLTGRVKLAAIED